MTRDGERIFLSYEEAVDLLPEGGTIHCFKNPTGNFLLGADWLREEVLDALRSAACIEVTGPTAQGMKHGLCVNGNYFESANYDELHPANP